MDPAAQTIDPVASGLLPATGEVSDLVPDGSYPQAPLAFDQSAVLVDWADADYATVLGLNYKFFEAQWSGPLPKDYRIAWREGGYLDVCDGLVGGSFEAGSALSLHLWLAFARALTRDCHSSRSLSFPMIHGSWQEARLQHWKR